MRELLRDPDAMSQIVRRRALRVMVPALGQLGRVARGQEMFKNDHQRFACVVLARMAAVVLGAGEDPQEPDPFLGPEWQNPEQILRFRRFEWVVSLPPDERERFDAEREVRFAVWRETLPDYTKMEPEDRAPAQRAWKGKTEQEVEDEGYPEHLRWSR